LDRSGTEKGESCRKAVTQGDGSKSRIV